MSGSCDDGDVHRQIDWMVPADVTTLEFLYQLRDVRGRFVIQTPNTISANTGYSRSHLSARLQVLADHDLVEQTDPDRARYRLSERGRQLLEGEISPDDLEEESGGEE